MTSTVPHVFVAPVPPYSVQSPAPPPPVRVVPRFSPVIAFKPEPTTLLPPPMPVPPVAARPARRSSRDLLLAAVALALTAFVCLAVFGTHAFTFATAAARFEQNLTLTLEARDVGLAAARQAALLRMASFGSLSLLLAAASALVASAGRRA